MGLGKLDNGEGVGQGKESKWLGRGGNGGSFWMVEGSNLCRNPLSSWVKTC